MTSHYRINVSKDGYYLFATEYAGITTEEKAKEVFNMIKERFPAKDGFNVTIKHYKGIAKCLDW